jgi:hypothetical protein
MIDLGKKIENLGMGMMEVEDEAPSKNKSVSYPVLYLNDISGLGEAPDVGTEGVAKIKYRVVSKNESERENQEGNIKESYAVDIDVMGIDFGSSKEDSSGEDEIEKGLSESEKQMEDED